MNVAGYIREPSSADSGEMFAQSERVRRWVARNGHHLVALCQDSGSRADRSGFRALLGLAERGEAEMVVLPGLIALSPDKVMQEIMLAEIRSRGLAVVSTEEEDQQALASPPGDSARMLIRDVMYRAAQFRKDLESQDRPLRIAPVPDSDELTDVLVEFIDHRSSAS